MGQELGKSNILSSSPHTGCKKLGWVVGTNISLSTTCKVFMILYIWHQIKGKCQHDGTGDLIRYLHKEFDLYLKKGIGLIL
jgi:hypothetical protein